MAGMRAVGPVVFYPISSALLSLPLFQKGQTRGLLGGCLRDLICSEGRRSFFEWKCAVQCDVRGSVVLPGRGCTGEVCYV